MKAFNLFLDPHPDSFPQTFPDDAADVGWVGTDGPAVAPEQWPRSPLSGLPMLHGFTLLLPEDYRTQGAEYVAISFFQGGGEFVSENTMSQASASSPSAWDTPVQVGRIRMTERTGDPNVGHAPNEDGEGDYQDPWDDSANKQHGWADARWEVEHVEFAHPPDAGGQRITPYS